MSGRRRWTSPTMALGRSSWPTTSQPCSVSTRRIPIRMMGPRFPSRMRGRRAWSIAGQASPSTEVVPARADRAPSPARSVIRACRSSGRAAALPPSRTRSSSAPGTSRSAVGLRAVGVRATRRWRPGARRSKRKRPSASVEANRPGVGQRDPHVLERLAVAVGDRAAGAVHLDDRAGRRRRAAGCGSVCVRTCGHLAAARRTRPRAGRRSPATPCTGRPPRSRSRPCRPWPGRSSS